MTELGTEPILLHPWESLSPHAHQDDMIYQTYSLG